MLKAHCVAVILFQRGRQQEQTGPRYAGEWWEQGMCERNVRWGERKQPAEGRDESARMWWSRMCGTASLVALEANIVTLCQVPRARVLPCTWLWPPPHPPLCAGGGEPWGGLLALWFWENYPKQWRKCIFSLLPSPLKVLHREGRKALFIWFFFSPAQMILTLFTQ